jgi:arylsulfatase A-like enzyme
VSHLDLWPTLIGAFGVQAASNRGTSLLVDRLPQGRVSSQSLNLPGSPGRWVGISSETHHLVLAPQSAPKLFDIVADPFELHDLAAQAPEIVRSMTDSQRAFLAAHARAALKALQPKADSAAEQALKKLGYTEGDDHK